MVKKLNKTFPIIGVSGKKYIFDNMYTFDDFDTLKNAFKAVEAVYIFTSGNSTERYVQGEILANTAKEVMKEANIQVKDLKDALEYAIKDCKNYTIFIVGSFYVYGNVIDILKEYKNT